jgi:hypothetical protein
VKVIDLKYIALGLIIGMGLMAFLISGMAYFLTSAPNSTPEPLPTGFFRSVMTPSQAPQASRATPLSSPTTQIIGTPTPDFIQSQINNGGLTFTGPLSVDQQIALYQASLGYVATTHQQSVLISEEVNGLRYGNPSNTCGPLAIAILRDAGLLSSDINPHDFWLLNTNIPQARALMNTVFPVDTYPSIRFRVPLNKFDWKTYPLEPGDFLFIHSGTGGNFDHMLVVNRVDKGQRAFAVTNYDTLDGFIISEVMLYDPNDPNAGIFHTWTAAHYAILGSTGFGGFEVWRYHAAYAPTP